LYVIAQEILRASCYGVSDGQAFAYGVGGTGPYSFSWTGTSQIVDTVNTLAAGLDTVTLTDSRGCIATDTVMIHQPGELIVSEDARVYAYCVGVNTASISVSTQGGTTPYSYLWNDNLPQFSQTTATAINLYAGIYTVIVTDDRGCIDSITIDVDSVSSDFSLVIDPLGATGTSISCYGANDGALVVSVDGSSSSVAPYTYQWIGPGFSSTNASITNLSAGLYSVTVTDANNCIVNESQTITEPPPLLYKVLSTTPASCLGSCDGQIQVHVVGGVAPYFGLGVPAFTPSAIAVDSDSIISGVCTGSYIVALEDANECLATLIPGGNNQAILSTSIPTTDATIAASNIPIVCNGDSTGTLTVLNLNLDSAYSYSWEDLNTSITTAGDSLTNVPQGTYVLSAFFYTDSFPACTATDTIVINQITLIQSSLSIINVDCNGNSTGVINTATQGGTPPYIYNWTPPHSNNDTIDNLSAGTYILSITDANNCQQEDTYIVTEPLALQLSIDSVQTYILTPTISGGTGPGTYTYSWRKQPQTNIEIGLGLMKRLFQES